MALTPIKIADVTVGSALVENWGRPTPYFQRYLQSTNQQITAAINGVIEAQLEAAEALALAEDAIEQIEALLDNTTELLLAMGLGAFNLATVTPDGSGIASALHNYSGDGTPLLGACTVTATGTTFFQPQLISVDGTALTMILLDASGAPITSGSWTVALRVARL